MLRFNLRIKKNETLAEAFHRINKDAPRFEIKVWGGFSEIGVFCPKGHPCHTIKVCHASELVVFPFFDIETERATHQFSLELVNDCGDWFWKPIRSLS